MQRQTIEGAAIATVSGDTVPPVPPAAVPQRDLVSQLHQLGELKWQGLLNDAEFKQAKKQLVGF